VSVPQIQTRSIATQITEGLREEWEKLGWWVYMGQPNWTKVDFDEHEKQVSIVLEEIDDLKSNGFAWIQQQIYVRNVLQGEKETHPGLVDNEVLDRMRADHLIVIERATKRTRNRDGDGLILNLQEPKEFGTFDVDGVGIQGLIKRAAFKF
jgi:hypothetical protein